MSCLSRTHHISITKQLHNFNVEWLLQLNMTMHILTRQKYTKDLLPPTDE